MRLKLFGKHIHNQIVIPLVVASVIVGFLASVVAVWLIGGIIKRWTDTNAEVATEAVLNRVQVQAAEMQKQAELAAQDDMLIVTIAGGDQVAISGYLVGLNTALDADNLMLVRPDGLAVASTGDLDFEPGSRPFSPGDMAWVDLTMRHPLLLSLNDRPTISVLEPVKGQGIDGVWVLVVSRVISDEFVKSVATGADVGYVVYDESLRLKAGWQTLDEVTPEQFLQAAGEPRPELLTAIREAGDPDRVTETMRLGGKTYRVRAEEIEFEQDPTGSKAYVVAIMGTGLTEDVRVTTTALIVMWSVAAVLFLMGLNWWVARRVTDPLTELSQSVSRVAEGDYATKVGVSGANEVSELAEGFNLMTSSLRDRSESLTKKVLELATLYEMSRALGSTLDLDVLLDSVLDSAMRIFNVELGYVMLRDKEFGTVELKAWRGPASNRLEETAVRSSMSEWVIREGRPLIFNPPAEGEEERQADSMSGALAALCVPLASAEGTIGAMTVGSRDREFRFTSDDVRLLSTIANHVTIAIGNIELFSSLQEAYLATVRALAAAVDAKDPFTRGHSDRVAMYALAIADELGLGSDQRIALEMAAYLHDIGKIGISEEILLKPGKLTEAEMGQMRHHPLIGANILRPVAFPWPIAPVVRHHHERYDGTGYPAGLKGEEIPLLARLLTAADAYEAMIADRPYRRGRTIDDAIDELKRCSGSHFDPRIVEGLVRVIHRRGAAAAQIMSEHEVLDVQPEEATAVFVAVSDGMFSSFRKLGGPRLAANLEQELNRVFADEDLPFVFAMGHMTIADGMTLHADDEGVGQMQRALSRVAGYMERTSGRTLVDHFYEESLSTLPERLRALADRLGLYGQV